MGTVKKVVKVKKVERAAEKFCKYSEADELAFIRRMGRHSNVGMSGLALLCGYREAIKKRADWIGMSRAAIVAACEKQIEQIGSVR